LLLPLDKGSNILLPLDGGGRVGVEKRVHLKITPLTPALSLKGEGVFGQELFKP
jgi:hypothetical protein